MPAAALPVLGALAGHQHRRQQRRVRVLHLHEPRGVGHLGANIFYVEWKIFLCKIIFCVRNQTNIFTATNMFCCKYFWLPSRR